MLLFPAGTMSYLWTGFPAQGSAIVRSPSLKTSRISTGRTRRQTTTIGYINRNQQVVVARTVYPQQIMGKLPRFFVTTSAATNMGRMAPTFSSESVRSMGTAHQSWRSDISCGFVTTQLLLPCGTNRKHRSEPSLLKRVASNSPSRSSRLSGSGSVLGSVPDTQYRHHAGGGHSVDDEVGRHDHQLPRPRLASGPTAVREHHQTIAGQ